MSRGSHLPMIYPRPSCHLYNSDRLRDYAEASAYLHSRVWRTDPSIVVFVTRLRSYPSCDANGKVVRDMVVRSSSLVAVQGSKLFSQPEPAGVS